MISEKAHHKNKESYLMNNISELRTLLNLNPCSEIIKKKEEILRYHDRIN